MDQRIEHRDKNTIHKIMLRHLNFLVSTRTGFHALRFVFPHTFHCCSSSYTPSSTSLMNICNLSKLIKCTFVNDLGSSSCFSLSPTEEQIAGLLSRGDFCPQTDIPSNGHWRALSDLVKTKITEEEEKEAKKKKEREEERTKEEEK